MVGKEGPRRVPAVCRRRQLLENAHVNLKHCDARTLFVTMRREFWWPQLRIDCVRVVGVCLGCQAERSTFTERLPLRPTVKPTAPLQGWSLDLLTDMKPSGPLAERHLLIAVDCFTKWVELIPLKTKESVELAEWLLHELVPRFGVPRFI